MECAEKGAWGAREYGGLEGFWRRRGQSGGEKRKAPRKAWRLPRDPVCTRVRRPSADRGQRLLHQKERMQTGTTEKGRKDRNQKLNQSPAPSEEVAGGRSFHLDEKLRLGGRN